MGVAALVCTHTRSAPRFAALRAYTLSRTAAQAQSATHTRRYPPHTHTPPPPLHSDNVRHNVHRVHAQFTTLVYALRLLCYYTLPFLGSVYWVLPMEILHGVCFGLCWGMGATL